MKHTRIVAALAALTATVVAAPPASAVSANGCTYPRVCFYLGYGDWLADRPTAAYQDVTHNWQWLGSRSRGAAAMWNTRNNDGAKLLMQSGRTECVGPNDGWQFIPHDPDYTVVAVRIFATENCT